MLYRLLLGAITLAAIAGSARAQDLSKYPDWSGQWRSMSGIQWDPTKPLGPAQQPPLTPEYQARYEASLADQAAGGLGDDPTGRCIPHGMPRVMTVVYPMEIVILPKTTYVLTDYTVSRRIFTDGRDWPAEMDQNFNGLSIGRWTEPDGDGRYTALVAETRGFKGPRTYEASGILLHADNQSVLGEVQSDKADKSILLDEITTIDNAFDPPLTVIKNTPCRGGCPLWHFNDCARTIITSGSARRLFPHRGRLSDAGQEESGAARLAVFHALQRWPSMQRQSISMSARASSIRGTVRFVLAS